MIRQVLVSALVSGVVSYAIIKVLLVLPSKYRPRLFKAFIAILIIFAGVMLFADRSKIESVQFEGRQVEFIEKGGNAYIRVKELSNMASARVRYEPESLTIMGEGWSIIQLNYLTESLILRSDGSLTQSSTVIRRGNSYYINAEILRSLGMAVTIKE